MNKCYECHFYAGSKSTVHYYKSYNPCRSPLLRHLGYDEETPSNSHLYVLSKGISSETNTENNKDIQVSGDTEGGASDDGATSHGGNLPNLYDPCVGDSSGVMPTQIYFCLF